MVVVIRRDLRRIKKIYSSGFPIPDEYNFFVFVGDDSDELNNVVWNIV